MTGDHKAAIRYTAVTAQKLPQQWWELVPFPFSAQPQVLTQQGGPPETCPCCTEYDLRVSAEARWTGRVSEREERPTIGAEATQDFSSLALASQK